MCGIFALLRSGAQSPFPVYESLDAISHRGPDDVGWLSWRHGEAPERGRERRPLTGEVILAQRRLAIIDLSEAGWQPMFYGQGRYAMTYNGEIYNYRELREELAAKGAVFTTDSDSEVLMAAWMYWGLDCFERLVGMFACVILDTETGETVVARDPFGIKPLFWCRTTEGVAFASEIWPLAPLVPGGAKIDQQRSYDYLRFGLTDEDSRTMLKGIHNFPAASYAVLQPDAFTHPEPVAYWRPHHEPAADCSFEEAAGLVRDAFLKNVELHMRSDVEPAAALSGGIDSSAIVCAMRRLSGSDRIRCFSFISSDKALSEESWVDLVADAASAEVVKVEAPSVSAIEDLEKAVRRQGEPFRSSSILAQGRVFEAAQSEGFKVLLNGQGADEIFAGYRGYRGDRLTALVARGDYLSAIRFFSAIRRESWSDAQMTLQYAARRLPWRKLKSFLRKLGRKPECPAWLRQDRFGGDTKLFAAHDFAGSASALKDGLTGTLTRTSLPALLRYDDRNAMACSIESRVPFLTTGLVDLAYSLPDSYLLDDKGVSKAVLREALRGVVPDAILDRKDKIGFIAPSKPLFENLIPRAMTQTEDAPDFLDGGELRRILARAADGPVQDEAAIWRIICYLQWLEEIRSAGVE